MGSFFLVTGDDEFAIKSRAREHIVALAGEEFEGNPDLEIIKGDTEGRTPAEIIGQFLITLNTPPFLSPRKIIWLRHYAHFKDSEEQLKDVVDQLKAGLPADVFVVIDGLGVDGRKAFAKAAKAVAGGEVEFFSKVDFGNRDYGKAQAAKLTELIAKHKKRLSYEATEFMVQAVGSDYGRMQMEVMKLVTYVGDKRDITLEDCRNIVSRTPEAASWEFANALTNGSRAEAIAAAAIALRQLQQSGDSGNGEIALVRQVMRSFSNIVKTRLAMAELGISGSVSNNYFRDRSDQLKASFPDNYLLKEHPYRAFMLVKEATRFTDEKITASYKALVNAYRALVSTGCDKRLVLEDLIYKVTG